MKNILAINGSANRHSANQQLLGALKELGKEDFQFRFCELLQTFPHFDPELSLQNPPEEISALREEIRQADGVLICTPEYVFSIPAGLKNLLEWCVADTAFTDKPVGLITASSSGVKGHEQLQMLMKTLGTAFTSETMLLISGVKSKVSAEGEITDEATLAQVQNFLRAFLAALKG